MQGGVGRAFVLAFGLACPTGACYGALTTPSAFVMCMQVTSGAAIAFFGLLAAFGRRLPGMQFRVASGPACLTGLLWSIGNFLSIYAVEVRHGSPLVVTRHVWISYSFLHCCWLSKPGRTKERRH